MDKYKEISKEEVLKLNLNDSLYGKKNNEDKYYSYRCIRKVKNYNNGSIYSVFVGERILFVYSNYEQKDIFDNYTFYLQEETTTYSAQEILDKIIIKELTDDDILIDRNGEQSTVYDILETDLMALIYYAPYTIKKNKYMSFNEAKKTGKKLKYKTWTSYCTLIEVYEGLLKKDRSIVNEMMAEKAWEVKE